jgi:hypothetical protein
MQYEITKRKNRLSLISVLLSRRQINYVSDIVKTVRVEALVLNVYLTESTH